MSELVSLAKIMLENHKMIGELFEKFKKSLVHDPKTSLKMFDDFMWHLEKHFFIEEKIIFLDYHPHSEEISAAISNLPKEHETMLNLSKKIEEALIKNRKVDNSEFNELRDTLLKHKEYEDEVLYPMLDLELSKAKKELICGKIKEYYKWQ